MVCLLKAFCDKGLGLLAGGMAEIAWELSCEFAGGRNAESSCAMTAYQFFSCSLCAASGRHKHGEVGVALLVAGREGRVEIGDIATPELKLDRLLRGTSLFN